MRRDVFYEVSHAVAYCANASRGLSATVEFLVVIWCNGARKLFIIRTVIRPNRDATIVNKNLHVHTDCNINAVVTTTIPMRFNSRSTAYKGHSDATRYIRSHADLFVCYAPPLIGGGIKRCFCLTSV